MAEEILVAVVDDSAPLRDLLRMALEEEGYRVLSASAGPDAIKLITREAGACRALITDVDLGEPDYTGWDCARDARELIPNIAVVYITGDQGHDWSEKGVLNSVLMNKPFVLDHVVTVLSILLDMPKTPCQ